MANSNEPRRTWPQMEAFYEAACEKGGRLWTRLAKLNPPSRTTLTLQSCQYKIEKKALRANTVGSLQKKLAPCGLLIKNMTYIDVRSVVAKSYSDAAYSNWFDAYKGIIVCNENFKERDKNPPDSKLFPSELLWQC